MAASNAITRSADANLTAVGWVSERELAFSDWILQGRRLGVVNRGAQWWLGDWLAYGNRRYGETYVKAARITGYDVQSLMNMTYVASRFEISRRRENVPWCHHATLAALAPADQDRWLDRIATDRLSVSCLRTELRAWEREVRPSPAPPPDATPAGHHGAIDCPACGHTFRPPGAQP